MKERHVRASKFLSLVLRHTPEKVGITLDPSGWVSVSRLLEALEAHGLSLTADGHAFFRAAHGVWLTEQVPARYINFGGDGERR